MEKKILTNDQKPSDSTKKEFKFCPFCGETLSSVNANFCSQCGKPLTGVSENKSGQPENKKVITG